MRLDWFQLPGPSSFVDRVADDIREGKSVVIGGAGIGTLGITRAIRNSLNQDSFSWVTLSPSFDSPLKVLFDVFEPARSPEVIPSLNRLFSLDNFQTTVIEVRITSQESWRCWIGFLEEFAYCSRSQNALSRSQMVILVNRDMSRQMPRPDLLLSILDADEISTISDMRIYALCLSERKSDALIKKELTASISAELSMWDRSLCERLCLASLPVLLNPISILLGYARERSWDRFDPERDNDKLKETGAIQMFGNREEVHSSSLAVQREFLLIDRRIWRGQTSVLFPLIETRRQELLEVHRDLFTSPIDYLMGE